MRKEFISLLVLVSLLSVGFSDGIVLAAKQKSKTGKQTITSQTFKKSAPQSNQTQTQKTQQKIDYLKQQSSLITANCQNEDLQEACAILQELLVILDQMQTNDPSAIISQLQQSYANRVALFYERFVKANQFVLRTLKKYRDFIENNIGPNQGTDTLNRDANELNAFLLAFMNDYATSYKKITAVYKKPSISSNQALTVYNAVIAYEEDLLNIIKNYPKYTFHIDISAHYLRALNNQKIFSNHKVYGEDVYDMAVIGETYYAADTENLKDLVKSDTGLVNQINKILPSISDVAKQWFALFTVQNQSQLTNQYATVRQNQNKIDVAIAKIYKKELEIAREICEVRNPDDPALCTYAYGAIFYAILDPNQTVSEALCAETPDSERCLENAELIKSALVNTFSSEDPSLESFFYLLIQEFLSDEQYDQVIAFIEVLQNALTDGELSEEEIALLKNMIINYDYSEERIEQFLMAICKNAEDVEACVDDIKTVANMIKQYQAGDLTIEEFMAEMFPDTDEITLDNISEIEEDLDNLHETIFNSIILLDGTLRYMENRSFQSYTNNLRNDLDYLQTTYARLLEVYYQILVNIERLAEITDNAARAQLLSETGRLIVEYSRLLASLEQFYLNVYYQHVYSGVFRVINYGYQRNVQRTDLMTKNLEDMVAIYGEMYPNMDWNSITSEINDIKPIIAEAKAKIPQVNEALNSVLLSSEPRQIFNANEIVSKQYSLNQLIRTLAIEKVELIVSLYVLIDAAIMREEEM